MKNKIYREKYKILTISIFFIFLGFLTFYIHFLLEVDIIYTHLFYFPTILACFWWKRKGLVLTVFIVGFLVFFPFFFRPSVMNIENFLRMLILICIGLFIVFLSEKISNVTDDLLENQKKLKKLNKELEGKVNERTKELKKSYELLNKHQVQLNAIFSNLKDSIFVISENYKILFKNENAHEIFGEELTGRNCYEIIKGADHPCEHCPIKTFKEKDICEVRFDQCIITPLIDGTRFFDIITTKIENYGGESAIVEVLRDITSRKKLQKELEEYSDKLEGMVEQRTKELRDAQEELVRKEKLAIIGKLASSIGHELRNPLGVISNSIYYLNMKIKDADVKVMKHLNIIQKEVERSNIIITDLLDFARTRPPALEEVDLCSIIKETLDNIKLPENIILEKNLDAELPRIQLDPNQIQRAFQNIILNAIQAMLKGGKLEIKTLAREDLLEIIFKDTGVGISNDNLEKIFEPLFTTKAKGIGLGLSIVKDIVERRKGKIEVESEVDVGTTFIVKLPFLIKEGI